MVDMENEDVASGDGGVGGDVSDRDGGGGCVGLLWPGVTDPVFALSCVLTAVKGRL